MFLSSVAVLLSKSMLCSKSRSTEHIFGSRNIEYDVWSCEKRPVKNHSPGKSSNSSSQSPNQGSNLGTLSPGTPCVIRDQHLGEIYGRVVRPCMDRRKIEVFLPSHGLPIFVPRKMVMPIKEFPPELVSLWEDAKMLFSDENDNKEHIGDNPEVSDKLELQTQFLNNIRFGNTL